MPNILPTLCGLFTLVYSILAIHRHTLTGVAKEPSDCLRLSESSLLVEVISCLDAFTVEEDYYTAATYTAAQPTSSQLVPWRAAVSALLNVDGNCDSSLLPLELEGIYTIQSFRESTGKSYCILLEAQLSADGATYAKGWGTLVIPSISTAVRRHIHFSAPHPKADLQTPSQAAALFSASGAKSLFIPGRTRTAYRDQTNCVQGHGSSGVYWKTDPAHDNMQPFYDVNLEIWGWQQMNGGCAASSCAFVQLHGKGASTCASDVVFLSTGLGTGATWYSDSIDRPIKRLRKHLAAAFPGWAVTMPNESDCSQTATKNVVGRFLNGVPDVDVCEKNALVEDVTGYFIHAEQSAVSRSEASYEGWITALEKTFVTLQ